LTNSTNEIFVSTETIANTGSEQTSTEQISPTETIRMTTEFTEAKHSTTNSFTSTLSGFIGMTREMSSKSETSYWNQTDRSTTFDASTRSSTLKETSTENFTSPEELSTQQDLALSTTLDFVTNSKDSTTNQPTTTEFFTSYNSGWTEWTPGPSTTLLNLTERSTEVSVSTKIDTSMTDGEELTSSQQDLKSSTTRSKLTDELTLNTKRTHFISARS